MSSSLSRCCCWPSTGVKRRLRLEEEEEAVGAAATAFPVPYTPLKFVETSTGKRLQPASFEQYSAPAKLGKSAGSTYSVFFF